ncbi:MAG: RNA polymerase sigma factor [Gammaproteobacteria bacterium]
MGQVAYIVTNDVYQDEKIKDGLIEESSNASEIVLLKKIVSHDRDAFHTVFSNYYPRLQRFISRLTKNNELIEEIINDVMFVIWQKAGDFKNRSRVSTWIFGIAYNTTLKSLAKQNRHKSTAADDIPEEVDPATPYTKLAQEQQLQQIQNSLEQLSIEHQTVVVLTYIYGYSYIEISEVMSCPVNTVKTRMFHARKNLQSLLPDFEDVQVMETI